VQDYRTYLAPWSGQPATRRRSPPSPRGGRLTVEASWNGATAVASWRVLAGPSATSLTAVTTAPRSGFETTISVATTEPYVAVAALDAAGRTLATSPAISPSA
jgi:hypothetical protein